MLSYVFMKILEPAPHRYDAGIQMLTLGHAGRVRLGIARRLGAEPGRVLEIGCGTGALAVELARRGWRVAAFDASEHMVSIARERVDAAGLKQFVSLRQHGVAEMDGYPSATFDVVVAVLVFSELSFDERRFTLRESRRVLRQRGRLILADEISPSNTFLRLAKALVRLPLAVLTYLLTQASTRALKDIEGEVSEAGFVVSKTSRSLLDSFIVLEAVRK